MSAPTSSAVLCSAVWRSALPRLYSVRRIPPSVAPAASHCITTACACVRCSARGSMCVRGVSCAQPPRISAGPPPAAGVALAAPACTCKAAAVRACIQRCLARVPQPSAAAWPGDAAGGGRPCCKRALESLELVLSYSAAGRSWRGWSLPLLLVAHPYVPCVGMTGKLTFKFSPRQAHYSKAR